MNYEQLMKIAIEIAKENPNAPFGAVLVDTDSGETVATGVNQSTANPTFHGEIVAINHYAAWGSKNWKKLVLFTTAEPCCMCQAAIVWAGIPKVVFGTSIEKLKELGWRQFDLTAQQVSDAATFSKCQLVAGVLEKQCDALFDSR